MNRDLPSPLWMSKCGEAPRELRRAVSAARTRQAHVAELSMSLTRLPCRVPCSHL